MAGQQTKNLFWLGVILLLSIAVLCIVAVMVFFLWNTAPAGTPETTPSSPPAVEWATATPSSGSPEGGPPSRQFIAQEPIQGYADCTRFGVRGLVQTANGQPAAGVEVMVSARQTGEQVGQSRTGPDGRYDIELEGQPRDHDLLVQLFVDHRPASEPVLAKIFVDCQNGFQIYQINWKETVPGK
ncbi:MAG: hypothetical protein D6784_10225 [Chloroflexi bacterium]|nr:MAG: hypothetical protein D6784_10225 [Chloroflexota bacterium]